MSFAALVFFLLGVWFGPWWLLGLIAFAFGVFWRGQRPALEGARMALAGGAAWAALAFLKDGQSAGLISTRLAALFNLPGPGGLFTLVFALGLVSAGLGFGAGVAARSLSKR